MDVVLVGPALPGIENHAIGALRAALRDSGVSETFVPFGGFTELERTVADVLAVNAGTVGVSLQTIESALAITTFTMLLRRRGFRGRIVVGGHFATLNAEALLRSPAEIDAVVQFAGEEALVALSRGALDDEKRATEVPGLVFRDARGEIRKGARPRWTSPAVLSRMPRFDPLPSHLGFSAADLVSTRGCEAHCSYCCIAAATDLARRGSDEHDSEVTERRSPPALADEMAALFHEHGARVFNFMDDNVLPLEPDAAAGWAEELKRELDLRQVPKVAFSLQLRADAVTERSARALVDLGLSRAYVGIDGYSSSQLRVLGRRADSTMGPRALELLWRQGVFAMANALLVGSTIPFESILHEVEALDRIAHAPVHLLPIEVRAGTSYFRAAERRGLVEGGFLHWHYRFADGRTERMAQILTSFPTRLAERSVPIALYDLGYNLGIARRLLPEVDIARHAGTFARVTAAWNADQSRILRAAAVAASRGGSAPAAFVAEYLQAVTAFDQRLRDDCDRALAELESAVTQVARRPVSGHSRGRILGAVAFSMSLAACGGTVEGRGPGSSSGGVASSGGTGSVVGSGGFPGGNGAGGALSGGAGGGYPEASITDASTVTCADGSVQAFGTATPGWCSCQEAYALVQFDGAGRASAFHAPDGGAFSPAILDCLTTLFAPYCYPSYANTTQSFSPHCWVA